MEKETNVKKSPILEYLDEEIEKLQKELSQADKGFSINYSRLNNKFSSAACIVNLLRSIRKNCWQ